MKNAIKYYYNLDSDSIHQTGKKYYFKAGNDSYVLLYFDNLKEINSIYKLNIHLLQKGLYCHQIILNNNNNLITEINKEPYILMKIFISKKNIELQDIISLNNLLINYDEKVLRRDNWYDLWTNKIDYFEYQINQIGKKHPLIIESFSYYIGLAENAIAFVNNIPKDNQILSLCHRRVVSKDTTYNLYNPLNFVLDIRIRDVCEYFKSVFFQEYNNTNEIILYLQANNFSYTESCYFLARLLFPTYYFDVYENILNETSKEEEIKKITNKVDDYETLLKKVYFYLKQTKNIPDIDWLKD